MAIRGIRSRRHAPAVDDLPHDGDQSTTSDSGAISGVDRSAQQTNAEELVASNASARRTELEALTTQARWLLEYHGRRSDSTFQRGTAVLAANGVLLGLIATSVRPQAAPFSTAEQICLLLAVWLVLASALFALAAIAPRKTGAPNVDDLQVFYATRYTEHAGRLHDDVLTTLLGTAKGAEAHENPVAEAAHEAARRAAWFKWSVRWLAAAIAALVAFVVYTVMTR